MRIRNFMIGMTLILSLSCSEDFLEHPVEDAITSDNFFKTDDQVLSASGALYGRPWFYYNDKFRWAMGDSYAGNSVGSFEALAQFVNFSMNPDNEYLIEGWESYWAVIANANFVLQSLEDKVGPDVSEIAFNQAKGEAIFIRAVAYFHLVRLWGAVPILEQLTTDTSNPVSRNTVDSVYRFIRESFEESANLLENPSSDYRIIGQTAPWAYLSKMYLTLKDYENAKLYADLVINSGLHQLTDNYQDQFINPELSVNPETIFALQWFVNCTLWGTQNTNQAYFAASGTITKSGDGWGTTVPSIDFINAYEEEDQRRFWTIMEPGNIYEELNTSANGFEVPSGGLTVTLAGYRKYVVGSPEEYNNVCFMRTEMSTHMMRYAEVLLIQAEAILGNNEFTTDANALDSYNQVRRRAGLEEKTSISLNDILQERRMELALESKYWFDLQRIDRSRSLAIIANQERGTIIDAETNEISSKKVVPSENDFLFPIPSGDAGFIADGAPVDYYATNN